MAETITTRAGSRSQERPAVVRALSTFSPAEQRAILALIRLEDSPPTLTPSDRGGRR